MNSYENLITMLLILDGNSDIDAHVKNEIGNLRHLTRSTAFANLKFILSKPCFTPYMCNMACVTI